MLAFAKRHRIVFPLSTLAVLALVLLVIPHGQVCQIVKDSKHQYCSFHNALSVGLFYFADLLSDFSAAITGLATLVIAAFTATLWYATRGMQAATTATLDHLRDEFRATYRPWVPVAIGAIELRFLRPSPTTCVLDLKIMLANVGTAPAIRAFPRLKLYYFDGGPEDNPVSVQTRFVEEARRYTATRVHEGFTVFPGQKDVNASHRVRMDESAVQKWNERFNVGTPHARLILVGLIDYFSALDGSRHQTGFIRDVHEVGAGGALLPVNPHEARDLPTDRLVLMASSFGDGKTD